MKLVVPFTHLLLECHIRIIKRNLLQIPYLPLPLEAVRQLADGGPVTKELVAALNPKRNEWEEIKAGLDKIGYPNEL